MAAANLDLTGVRQFEQGSTYALNIYLKTQKQVVTVVGSPGNGTFNLAWGVGGFTTKTGEIAYNASAATVQLALEKLVNVGVGRVTVTGSAGGPWTVEFSAEAIADNGGNPLMIVDFSGMTAYNGSVGVVREIRNLTGYTGRMQIRQTVASGSILLELTTSNARMTITGASGLIALTVTATDMAAVSWTNPAYYDLEIVNGAVVEKVMYGQAYLYAEVTR